ncbi:MAG: protein translocase SEC61 complex subunit gamma [Candidatus Micrarchaeota archaeon]
METGELVKRCIRILHISRKPTGAEYSKVAKVTAVGMLIFGLVGFVIEALAKFLDSTIPNLIR